jgi:ribosomal protein S18 acetylase RimI-like enzyme
VFVSLTDDDGVLAVARGAVDDRWLGVTAVEVVPRARRRGLGMTLMRDLLDVGDARGARFTYLQVTEENAAARAFYDRLGYLDHHGYHYRRPAR